jgi:hypothetical protein
MPDTMLNAPNLAALYQRTSKHSNYQVLPPAVAPLVNGESISVKSRFERERLRYILANVPVAGLRMADIGGNTGFFAFELLAHGASTVDYHEGNAAHHAFVTASAAQLGMSDRLRTHLGYVTFSASELPRMDCTLLLNVLHHLGDDFGDAFTAKAAAKAQMLSCLAQLARTSAVVVFQLGFNWKGDRHLPLFEHGTKAEMIDFVRRGTAADWDIASIGVAERDGDAIDFRPLDSRNVARDDSLGEFLNRPLFIMRSRHINMEGATP